MSEKEFVKLLVKIQPGILYWAEQMLEAGLLKKKHWEDEQEVDASIQSHLRVILVGETPKS